MYRIFVISFFTGLLFSINAGGQSQRANYWAFGSGAGLDFSSGAPVAVTTDISTFEGSAAICDLSGNLLMYTNGGGRDPSCCTGSDACSHGEIWNMNHSRIGSLMTGDQGGGSSAVQSSIIIPKPGSSTNYYVFCMEEKEYPAGICSPTLFPRGNGFTYCEIDMSMNGGLGGMVSFNQKLHPATSEGLTATKHANGNDWWVIIHTGWFDHFPFPPGIPTDSFLVYRVTSAGIQPPVSIAHEPVSLSGFRITPDGQYLYYSSYLLPFDNSSGWIDTSAAIDAGNGIYGVSPNAELIYTVEWKGSSQYDIYQCEVNAPDIDASKIYICTISETLANYWQIGPNKKLYIPISNSDKLSVIHCPNQRGTACDYEEYAITLNAGTQVNMGFINFPDCWFYSNDSCGGMLPVNMADFTGKKQGSKNILRWTTAGEFNNDRFIVERSNNGKCFNAIGTVYGAGNSSKSREYSFIDYNPLKKINYYRLKQVDFDGSDHYSSTIAVNTEDKTNEFIINQSEDVLHISNNNLREFFTVEMYNTTGKKVFQGKGTGTIRTGLENIPRGLYIINIQTGEDNYVSKCYIIN